MLFGGNYDFEFVQRDLNAFAFLGHPISGSGWCGGVGVLIVDQAFISMTKM